MTGDLDLLPWRQRAIGFAQGVLRPLFQPCDLVADIDRLAVLGKLFQFEDLPLEVGNRLFEIEIIEHALCGIHR